MNLLVDNETPPTMIDKKNIANVRTKYHRVMHTKVYFEEVNNLIGSAYSSGGSVMVINVLGMLKDVLEEL